jgi:hypothetical protein
MDSIVDPGGTSESRAQAGSPLRRRPRALHRPRVQPPTPGFDIVTWKWFTNPDSDFTTSSHSLVASNLPVNPTFVKQRSDTYLWIFCVLDLIPSTTNGSFNAIMLDDSIDLLQVSIAGPAGQLIVANITDMSAPIAAGTHTFKLYVATNGGSCTWLTPLAAFKILEVSMPPPQP